MDCDIASYHLKKPIANWSKFIEGRIEDAEYILLVCTKELKEQLAGQSHNRVEMTNSTGPHILSSTLNVLLEYNPRTLPIILEEDSKNYIPMHLRSGTIYAIAFDSLPNADFMDKRAVMNILHSPEHKDLRSLVTRLLNQQEILKPPVASKPPDLTSKIILLLLYS